VVADCTGSDDTLRVWDIKPQSSESARLAHNSSILGMCWTEYDTGILTLCSDGSVNVWTLKVCFLRLSLRCRSALILTDQDKEWHRDKLFHVHSSTLTDMPNGMAYTKDRIAVSTLTCVKVWLMINGEFLFSLIMSSG